MNWQRFKVLSLWEGMHISMIVLQCKGDNENWKFTARGYRELENEWSEEFVNREQAEEAALKFYLEKE